MRLIYYKIIVVDLRGFFLFCRRFGNDDIPIHSRIKNAIFVLNQPDIDSNFNNKALQQISSSPKQHSQENHEKPENQYQ